MERLLDSGSVQPTPVAGQPIHALAAALWPLACAVVLAVYAFVPQRFPTGTGLALCLMAAAELPGIMVGLVYVGAMKESTARARVTSFLLGVGLLIVITIMNLGFDRDALSAAPALAWIMAPYLIDLCRKHDDRELVGRQTLAVLEDKLHLISLLPSLVIAALIVTVFSVAALAGLSIAFETDLTTPIGDAVRRADPRLFASIGIPYLLVVTASTFHVHRPAFLRTRRRLLDRPWIHRFTIAQGGNPGSRDRG